MLLCAISFLFILINLTCLTNEETESLERLSNERERHSGLKLNPGLLTLNQLYNLFTKVCCSVASIQRNITVQLEVPVSGRFVLCWFEHCCVTNRNVAHKLLAAEHSTLNTSKSSNPCIYFHLTKEILRDPS